MNKIIFLKKDQLHYNPNTKNFKFLKNQQIFHILFLSIDNIKHNCLKNIFKKKMILSTIITH